MSELLEFGRQILKKQAFSVFLGATLSKLQPGIAEVALPVREEFKQQHGFIHGGVISYLADNALGFVGGSVLTDVVTSEYKINYVRPAIGQELIAKATVLASGKRQAICQAKVFVIDGDEEKLVAVAQGTLSKIA